MLVKKPSGFFSLKTAIQPKAKPAFQCLLALGAALLAEKSIAEMEHLFNRQKLKPDASHCWR
jgi:hypothetical protein